MKRTFILGGCAWLAIGFILVSQCAADDPQAGKLVTLEVVIADVPEGAAAAPTAAAILDLEKAGKLSGLARYRLSSLENQQASIQFGELAPIVSARNMTGGGRGGPGGFGGVSNSYTQVSVGTQVATVSRVESADAIVTDLKIQRSSVTPAAQPAADAADPNAFTPQGTVTLNIQTTVRTRPGEPTLLIGRQLKSGKETTQTWVVLTASVAAAAPAEKRTGALQEAEERLKVFQVVNGSAPAMANVLMSVLQREGVRIAVDERTNTLVMRGDPGQLEIARALISRLDVAGR